jgi:hypothetical protein
MNLSQLGAIVKVIFQAIDNDVLTIPSFDSNVVPDQWSYRIDRLKTPSLKQLGPVIRPLFVDVIGTALHWNGSGEKDHRRQSR